MGLNFFEKCKMSCHWSLIYTAPMVLSEVSVTIHVRTSGIGCAKSVASASMSLIVVKPALFQQMSLVLSLLKSRSLSGCRMWAAFRMKWL